MGTHSLLQGIFLTQGSNLSLLHCQQILYHLNYQGSISLLKLDCSTLNVVGRFKPPLNSSNFWCSCFQLKQDLSRHIFSGGSDGKQSIWFLRVDRTILRMQVTQFYHWIRKIPWRRKWQPTLVFLPGKSHGQRSLLGYYPWSCKESDTTEWLSLPHSSRDGTVSYSKLEYTEHQ